MHRSKDSNCRRLLLSSPVNCRNVHHCISLWVTTNICGMALVLLFPSLLIIVYFAANHSKNGGIVQLQNYLSMPHVFLVFENHPSSKTCYSEVAKFIRAVSSGQKLETRMETVNGRGFIELQPLEMEKFPTTYTKAEVLSEFTLR